MMDYSFFQDVWFMEVVEMVLDRAIVQLGCYAKHLVNVQVFPLIIFTGIILGLINMIKHIYVCSKSILMSFQNNS